MGWFKRMGKRKANIVVRGVAGPEADIAAVRVYLGGVASNTIPVTAGAEFSGVVVTPQSGDVLLEHSFVDSRGNESPRFQQTISIPRR